MHDMHGPRLSKQTLPDQHRRFLAIYYRSAASYAGLYAMVDTGLEVVLAAVENKGSALKLAHSSLHRDRQLLIAVPWPEKFVDQRNV